MEATGCRPGRARIADFGVVSGAAAARHRSDPVVTDTIAVGAQPTGIAADGRAVWVANTNSDSLTRIDGPTTSSGGSGPA